MPAGSGYKGRSVIFHWNGAVIPGVREKGITINGGPIDVSADDSAGKRELLEVTDEDSVDISLSGVTKSSILRLVAFGANRIGAVVIEYPNGETISGDFFLASYSEGNPYKDASTFEASLQSTGNFAHTAAT